MKRKKQKLDCTNTNAPSNTKKQRKKQPTSSRTLATSTFNATMPKAIATAQRINGCWVPPVIALSNFYHIPLFKDQTTKITMETIRKLRSGDAPEECCEVFEEATGICCNDKSWSNDATFLESDGKIKCSGSTSLQKHGTWQTNTIWFEDLKATIQRNDAVVLLVERQERKDKGRTHYLVVFGYEEKVTRRSGTSHILYVKDPTEGDALFVAELWAESNIELSTKQGNGSILDRYMILEATHLCVRETVEVKQSVVEIDSEFKM